MSEHNHDCGCGCNHDEEMTITLTLDNDEELECAVVAIFPVNEKQYIALLPKDQESDDEGEVYLYRFTELENDEIDLQNIEDDDEYDDVSEAFDALLDEEDINELLDEEN